MWSSIVVARRASLSRLARGSKSRSIQKSHLQPQVPYCQTLISIESPFSSHFYTWVVAPTTSFYQNPRFFSHDSSNPTDEFEKSHIESTNSETSVDDVVSDSHNVLDESPSPVLPEFEDPNSSMIFDESNNIDADTNTLMEDGLVLNDGKSGQDNVNEVDLEQLLENVRSLLQSHGMEGSFESSLENMGLTLNEDFVIKVLKTPLVPGENLIGFFRWAWKKPEFSVNTGIVDALVQAICSDLRKKDAYALWDLVKELGEKENGMLNSEILNQLISLLSRLGKAKAGFEVFNKFGEFGCVPNPETYYFTIEALCRRSFFDWASSVCEKMLSERKLPNSEKIGRIILYLCKVRKAEDAHKVYLLAKETDNYPPRASVFFLIGALSRVDKTVHLALQMLEGFSGEERKYATKPFSVVISGLCRINDVEGAKKLLFKMIDAGPPPGNAVFNSIINSLSKAGDMEEAMKIMKMIEDRGLKPDVYTYTVMMSGYAKGGEMEEACKLLAEAKKKHTKLCPVTYHTLVRGYCKLENFDKALELLGEMKEYVGKPSVDEYQKLIQSLCLKALDWETAEKLLGEMKENGLYLNGITRGLIRAVKEMVEEEGEEGVEEGVIVEA
ncbi:small ribosomal subunit protein mS80 (rPPR6)-like [Cornus florida]|uniref:small ribosomal subunit protein mS80 (rPPR6)-like n=1 Tax=Cornus florida TaxID=4283 RepID=UPI00289B395C|nr:small ribosomal subunit protein mS80 (rPPR6)-like [Cornus florida]